MSGDPPPFEPLEPGPVAPPARAALPPPGRLPPPPPPPPPGSPPGGFAVPAGYVPYTLQGAEWRYAGWWARVGAALLDGLFAGALVLPGNIVSAVGPKQLRPCTSNPVFTCSVPTDATTALSTTLIIIGFLIWIVLYARWVASGRGSLGQRATHIRIVDANTGAPVGAWRAFGRRLAWVVSYFFCFLGFFWMLWDGRKQTFHDKIASTVVIRLN